MTVVGQAGVAGAAPASPAAPRRTLRPDRASWPLWLVTAGLPITYVLGFYGVAWNVLAIVLGARLLANRATHFPRSTIPLVLFVCWIPLSFSVLGPSNLPIFTYRWTLFIGALAAMVWVINVSEKVMPTRRIVDWLAWLWIFMIGLGWLAQVLPNLDATTPFQVVTGPLGRIEFFARISKIHLADVQPLLGRDIARPAAPFGATNSWGSAIGILTPFFVRSWIVDVDRKRRRTGLLLLAAAVLPILTSVNRGLWISLVVGLVYFAARKGLRGKFGPLVVLLAAMLTVGTLFVATPAGTIVTDRLSSADESNESRGELYKDAWRGAVDSPLVGNGVPRETDYYENSPPVGTHGLLWYLMFIHGFVGLALFLSWLVIEVFRSGRVRTSLAWWTHLSLVIALIEVPYYGLLPHVVLVGVAAGLAHREAREATEAVRASTALAS